MTPSLDWSVDFDTLQLLVERDGQIRTVEVTLQHIAFPPDDRLKRNLNGYLTERTCGSVAGILPVDPVSWVERNAVFGFAPRQFRASGTCQR